MFAMMTSWLSKMVILTALLAQGHRGGGGSSTASASPGDIALAGQREARLRADHKKNLDDAAALLKLAEDLKSEIEKQDPNVVSVKNIKETEDIQKLAKNIRGRLNRN